MLYKQIFALYIILCVIKCSVSHTEVCSYANNPSQDKLKCHKDDPDIYSDTMQIIARHGYPAESHIVTTQDGYLLTVHRIPYSKNQQNSTPGQPVLLQHGLLGSSNNWLLSAENSLAFILSDAGYDVWLGNARGNMYSRSHKTYTPWDSRFWDFSWYEMGKYDLPAVLSFIEQRTGKYGETIYIGHSMGTTMFFVYSSMYNANKTVAAMVALAPVAYMTNVQSPIKYLAPFVGDIKWIAQHLGINEFLPSNKILKFLATFGCDESTREMDLCEDLMFMMCGFDKEEFNATLLPSVLYHGPAGSSTKTVLHYLQEINANGQFQRFDYGESENMERYGSKKPPHFNLTQINVPIYLMAAKNDWLAGLEDVRILHTVLNYTCTEYDVPFAKFNHIDFLWGKNAPQFVYKPLMKFISQYA